MISRIVVALLVIFVGACVGILVLKDAGYILIEYANLTVETSLWVGIAILVFLGVFIYACIAVYRVLASSNNRLWNWRQRRQKSKSVQETVKALQQEVEGDLRTAHQLLMNASKHVENPVLHYAYVAKLATEIGDSKAKSEILTRISSSHSELTEWEKLHLAKDKSKSGELSDALVILQELHTKHPKSQTVAVTLLRTAASAKEWTLVQELLEQLKSSELIAPDERAELLVKSWREKLDTAADSASSMWKTVPSPVRENPSVVVTYAKALILNGELNEARSVLTKALTQHWDSQLIQTYGLLELNPLELLKQAEKWHGSHSDDSDLLLALGRLSKRTEQYVKAREYLEASLRISENRETYLELAQLCLMTDETERASHYLKLAS